MIRGKRISGRYKILDMIGGGGMANVYLAHDMILDRDVAVKMLRLDFANDEEFIRRFHREAQSATSLAHANIVSIYDVGEEDGLYYIVMEYVDGPTLKQYIQQNAPVPIEKTLDIMGQLTSAISHAHHNHIIHRDIKPQNILIDPEGNVKITDFGIAMALSATSITQTNSVLGSVHYLSPEQARGGMATNKSDIYSLGIVMFELLTGRLPFSGESAVSIALKHLQSETPSLKRWNPGIPQSVENIVLKATAKDPFHRYVNVYEMEEDLRTSLNPDRLDEPKFAIPEDDEATKAIPVITDDRPLRNLDETLIHREQPTEAGKKENKKQKKDKQEKKKQKKWPLILSLVFVFLAIAITGFMVFGVDLFGPKEVTVPEVEGMELEEAVADLLSAGFVIGNQKEISDEKIEEGSIIKSSPKSGRVVKEGTAIDLYISTGKARFELSDYRGRMYEDTFRTLKDKNFKDVEMIEEHDDSEAGTILNQYPSGGEEVIPDETVVEFTVSKGPELIELIDLTDYNEKSVSDYATTNGLVIEKAEEFHDTVEKGLVISQDPEPGTRLNKGSKVKITYSKGIEEIPKTVTEDIAIPYDETLNGEPQEVQIYIDDMNHDINEPAETFEIKETTTKKITLNIPYKGKAAFRVMSKDGVVIEDEVEYPEE